jgi:hypothetical protein
VPQIWNLLDALGEKKESKHKEYKKQINDIEHQDES